MKLRTIPSNQPIRFNSIIYKRYKPTHFKVGDPVFDRRDSTIGFYVRMHHLDIVVVGVYGVKEIIPSQAAYRLEQICSLN